MKVSRCIAQNWINISSELRSGEFKRTLCNHDALWIEASVDSFWKNSFIICEACIEAFFAFFHKWIFHEMSDEFIVMKTFLASWGEYLNCNVKPALWWCTRDAWMHKYSCSLKFLSVCNIQEVYVPRLFNLLLHTMLHVWIYYMFYVD